MEDQHGLHDDKCEQDLPVEEWDVEDLRLWLDKKMVGSPGTTFIMGMHMAITHPEWAGFIVSEKNSTESIMGQVNTVVGMKALVDYFPIDYP